MRKVLTLLFAAFLVTSAATSVRAEDDAAEMDYEVMTMDDIVDDEDDGDYEEFHWGGPGRPGRPHRFMNHPNGHNFQRRGPGRMGQMHGMQGMRGMGRYMDLDLTEAQRNQLADILTENYRETLDARFAIIEAKKALADVYRQDQPQERDIISAHEALGAATGRMAAVKRGLHTRIAGILTPEQKERFESRKDDRPGRRDRPDRDDRRERRDRDDRPGRGPRGDKR